MKKILFLLTILVSVPAFSQSADERIGAFLNQADWFGLEKNYPILAVKMHLTWLSLHVRLMVSKGIMPQPHKTREALWNNSNSKMQNKECTKALKVSVISMIS